MAFKKLLATLMCSLVLLLGIPANAWAAVADLQPHTATGYTQNRYDTNGASFGSNWDLGLSGSTPGFVINRNGPGGEVRTLATADNADTDWGWLGWFGLIGLIGIFPVRSKTERSRYT